MSSYFNEAGEPLMTAAEAAFEAGLDAEPDAGDPYDDSYYDWDDNEDDE